MSGADDLTRGSGGRDTTSGADDLTRDSGGRDATSGADDLTRDSGGSDRTSGADDLTRTSGPNRDDTSGAGRAGGRGDSAPLPSRVGHYRILRIIGEGGMGTVYEAEQENPRRLVALKVIKLGFATPSLLRRFEQESQILGRLQHPGIAQIYEAGTADTGLGPQPYFAMEFVVGSTLDSHVRSHKVGVRARLELVARLCDAVQHAHQKGIVHRDLKPGNILVDESGQPKILDFGVARVTDSDIQATRQTDLGQIIGTLPYMSPEQVGADPSELDIRSDVYALGVILYEMLAGRLPYDLSRKNLPEAVRIIQEEDPTRLSTVSRVFRGDVETIVAKALAKEKERRYQSAADLGADIQRYLKDEPIVARPASTAYQLGKFARRNKVLVGGIAAVFLVLLMGVVASTVLAIRAQHAEALATSRLGDAQQARALAERKQKDSDEARELAERRRLEAEQEKAAADGARKAEAEQRGAAEASAEQAKKEAAKADAVKSFLQEMLASVDPTKMKDKDVTVREALDEAAKKVDDGSLTAQPEVEASVRMTLGLTYHELGQFAEAESQERRAVALNERVHGRNSVAHLDSLTQLARTLVAKGDLPGAEPLEREALDIARKTPQASLAPQLQSLGMLLQDKGDLAGAEPLIREALAIGRKVYSKDPPSIARLLSSLAGLRRDQGDLAEAAELYQETLDIDRRSGNDTMEVAYDLNNLAAVRRDLGDFPAAEKNWRESLRILQNRLGEDHPTMGGAYNNLASVLRDEGDLNGAEENYRKALAIWRKALGNEHPNVGAILNNLANVLNEKGDLASAEPLYREALEIWRKVLGPEHPNVGAALNSLAALRSKQGDIAGAEALFRESLAIRTKALGEDNPATAVIQSNLADLLLDKGDAAGAEPLLRHVVDVLTRKLPPRHRDTATAISRLGRCLTMLGRPSEAEPLLRDALSIQEEKLPPTHWARFSTMSLLGECLGAMGKSEEAERLLLEACEGMRKNAASSPVTLRKCIERIVHLYEATGKPDKAASWRAMTAGPNP